MAKKWRSVQIPDALYKEVEELLKTQERFSNPSEFIRDAVRHSIEKYEEEENYVLLRGLRNAGPTGKMLVKAVEDAVKELEMKKRENKKKKS